MEQQSKARTRTSRRKLNSQSKLGPKNKQRFQTISFRLPGIGRILRVSINLEKERQWLAAATTDRGKYSPGELDGLRTAATIIAAKDSFQSDGSNPEQILDAMLQITPDHMIRSTEECFSPLTALALQMVSDVCVKRGISKVASSMGAPPVYDEEVVDGLIDQFRSAVKGYLGVPPTGRPVETKLRLLETAGALKRLAIARKKPTQELIAEELGIEPRSLRDWPKSCGLNWNEFLRASRFSPFLG